MLILQQSAHAGAPGTANASNIAFDLRSDSFDVLHTTANLDFTAFTAKNLQASTTLLCVSKINGLRAVSVDLYRLTIDSLIVNGTSASYSSNDSSIRITLPSSLNINDTFRITIGYHGTPYRNLGDWGGFYWDASYAYNIGVSFIEQPHSFGRVWIPCVDNFVERCTFEYFVKTDNTRRPICGGLLLDSVDHGDGTTTWHWQIFEKIPSYLASVSVAHFSVLQSSYSGISRTIPIMLAAVPADTARLAASFIHLTNALNIFETHYGPYRFDRVGYNITPFSAGAMEHACNITYMQALVDGTTNYETTMAHELSHHWFGDLVTCENAGDMWLNEGWASYSERVFTEFLFDKTSYKNSVRNNHDVVLHQAHIRDSSYLALADVPSVNTYGTTVYDKGSDVAHTLRGYMGDSVFFYMLHSYFNDKAWQNVSSAQFRDYISTHTSFNANDFFAGWVFAPGFPQFGLDAVRSKSVGGGNETDIWIRQKLNHAPNYFNNVPLEISFFDANWNRMLKSVSMSGSCDHFSFSLPFQPVFTAIDYDEKISDAICDEVRKIKANGLVDFGTARLNLDVKRVSDSVLVRVEHNWVAPDPMKHKIDGLILSDRRYWTIDGIFDTTFIANATFLYNGTTNLAGGYLDETFISNSEDSLVMLWRADATKEWSICDSFKVFVMGSSTNKAGKITVYNMKKGQYAMAIYDHARTDTSTYHPNCIELGFRDPESMPGLEVYPNPAGDFFFLTTKNLSTNLLINIFDAQGKKVLQRNWDNTNKLSINCKGWSSGTYIISATALDSGNSISQKLIIP
jgi:aminopeptidase N